MNKHGQLALVRSDSMTPALTLGAQWQHPEGAGGDKSQQTTHSESRNIMVSSSPLTNNQFAALATEDELRSAFKQLQKSATADSQAKGHNMDTSTAKQLEMVVQDESGHKSDGMGTQEVSKIGVRFMKSAPNSDDEEEVNTQLRKGNTSRIPMRRSTRPSKAKIIPDM